MTFSVFPLYVIAHPAFDQRFRYIKDHVAAKSRMRPLFFGVIGAEALARPGHGHDPALKPGEVGCALSHVAAYRHMVDHGIEKAIVIEDDVILPDGFDAIASAVLAHLREGEVISLHSPMMGKRRLSLHGAVTLAGSRICHPFEPGSLRTNSCYAIHIDAAARIAAANDPVRMVADRYHMFWKEGLVNSLRLASPQIAGTAGFESVIGYHRPGLKKRIAALANRLPVVARLLKLRRIWLRHRGDGNHVFTPDPSPLAAGNPAFRSRAQQRHPSP